MFFRGYTDVQGKAGSRLRARKLIRAKFSLESPMVSAKVFLVCAKVEWLAGRSICIRVQHDRVPAMNCVLTVRILSSHAGLTLGTPIAVAVPNTDQRGGVSSNAS